MVAMTIENASQIADSLVYIPIRNEFSIRQIRKSLDLCARSLKLHFTCIQCMCGVVSILYSTV